MGGMITQALVIRRPELFATACSVMSTTGDPSVGAPTGEALTALLRPVATSREEAIEASIEGSRVIGSPGYPTDEHSARAGGCGYNRSYCPRERSGSSGRSSVPRIAPKGCAASTCRSW